MLRRSFCTVALTPLLAAQSKNDSEIWRFDRLENIGGHATKVEGHPRLIDTPDGKAVEFDGVQDALFVDSHPLAGAETFTWEVIFRPASGGKPEQRFFHLQQRDSQIRYLFETRLVGGDWYLDAFANTSAGSRALMDKSKMHPLDRWYHVAMVYDGQTFRNYVDGVVQVEASVKLAPEGPGSASVGVRMNRVDYFKGAMRLARFTKRALQPAEFLKAGAQ